MSTTVATPNDIKKLQDQIDALNLDRTQVNLATRVSALEAAVARLQEGSAPIEPPIEPPVQPPAGPPAQPADLPEGVTLVNIDGGPDYFTKWPDSRFPANDTLFPIGHWAVEGLDSQASLDQHKGRVNVFVEDGYAARGWQQNLNSDGFYSVGQAGSSNTGAGGSLVTDEVDQWAGNGWGGWSGKVGFGQDGMCTSGSNDCGFTALKDLAGQCPDTRFKYVNFGKMAGCQSSKADYQTWASMVDVMSTDVYFFQEGILGTGWWGVTPIITDGETDGDIPANDPRIRRSSNYGRLVKHQRNLLDGAKPVWSFHELVAAGGGPVDAEAFRAGLWSAVINGARGIVYFTHNYLGGAGYANSFQDPAFSQVNVAAKKFYAQTQALAVVINSPDAVGLASATGTVDLLAKWNSGDPYLFVQENQIKSETVAFTVRGAFTKATVVDEDREIAIVDGRFSDTFASVNTVHIYHLS